MTSIPELTAEVKTSSLPGTRSRKRRTYVAARALPHYALHTHAPTLPDIQKAASGVFARLMVMRALEEREDSYDR
ncbi:MAG: hypothetical protein H0U76_15360 [Ktedonobacteraceae bacterium]|nr:hypothetical protein [Ktedonobacteraceae bacterium]